MSIKIESHNQKGGITGNKVIVGNQDNIIAEAKQKKNGRLWKKIGYIIMVLAAVVAILIYLDITPFTNGK